jgi:flagellar biogenesis protein FliO
VNSLSSKTPEAPSKPKNQFSNLHQLAVEMKTGSQAQSKNVPVKPKPHEIEEETLPLPQSKTANPKQLTTKEEPITNIEEENVPILFNDGQQQATDQASKGLMWRMILSLVAVLGLFFAFTKWLLPGLVARYPNLFSGQQNNTGNLQRPSGSSVYKMNNHFNVITSTPLGKEKELHLVEIQGRQLIIATTPYTVTFIKELTEPTSSSADLNTLLHQAGIQEAPKPGQGWLKVDEPYQPRPSQFETYRATRGALPKSRSNGLKPETHSELPPSRKMKPKPLAAKVPLPEEEDYSRKVDSRSIRHNQPARSEYQSPQPEEPLHLKYLQSDAGEHEPLKADGLHNLYKEPEDVVLLDDYDDIYQGSPRQY